MNALPSWIIPLGVLGTLLSLGLLAGLLFERFGAPRVAAYLLVGVACSKELLGRVLPITLDPWAEPITLLALGVIAYLIGGSLSIAQLRKLGRVVIGGTLGESLGAVTCVTIAITLLSLLRGGSGIPPLAIALGAIAATTDAAASVAVIHQYRARGPVSQVLLGVVALDDAVGIILFSVMYTALRGGSLGASLLPAVLEIVGSIALGALAGGITVELGKRIRRQELVLPLIVGLVALLVTASEGLGLSTLLTPMSMGFVARAVIPASAERLFAPIELIEELVFIVFFGLAGMQFQASLLIAHTPIVVTYVIARLVGKYFGARVATHLVKAPRNVSRNLGLALVPQAGVAVGLALRLSHETSLGAASKALLNVVLGSTLIYEFVGPLVTRFALKRAGEIHGAKRMRSHERT